MLLMPNKKKVASVIVASMTKPKDFVQKLGDENGTGEYKVPEGEESYDSLEAAMDEFLKAAESKDAKAMAKAFRNAMVLCDEQEPEGEAV